MFLLNGTDWTSIRHFSLKFTGIILPILSVYVSNLNLLLILNFSSPRRVISKFILVLKQWLLCMIFSAITLLHLRIHSSKNYLLISLHVSTLISLITSPMNTPQMMNQFIQSTLQFPHFIPMIQLISLKYFYILFVIQLQDFYHHSRVQNVEKGHRTRTTDEPEESPQALHFKKTAGVGKQLQLFSTLRQGPSREQPDPPLTVEQG